jgi:hypothetical protein
MWLQNVVKYGKYSPVKLANFGPLSEVRKRFSLFQSNDEFATKCKREEGVQLMSHNDNYILIIIIEKVKNHSIIKILHNCYTWRVS